VRGEEGSHNIIVFVATVGTVTRKLVC